MTVREDANREVDILPAHHSIKDRGTHKRKKNKNVRNTEEEMLRLPNQGRKQNNIGQRHESFTKQ